MFYYKKLILSVNCFKMIKKSIKKKCKNKNVSNQYIIKKTFISANKGFFKDNKALFFCFFLFNCFTYFKAKLS